MLATDTVLQGRYQVVRLIAQGGMGAVYEARDQRLGNTVALKETFFHDEQLRRAFEREARLLAGLRHAALPVVSDHFIEDTGQFLIMQFIPGDDLAAMLEHNGKPFDAIEVLRWADLLLDALDYLHSQEPPVIHRDIKPQNLKLTARGEVILLDFGLAKGSPQLMSQVSGTGSILGYTPHYAPLEQIQGSGTDPRSDLYSLAATVYHLLTNAPPADALTRASASVSDKPDPLRLANELNPDVSVAVAAVLMKAMQQNRDKRPVSALEMRDALKEAMRATGGSAQKTAVMGSQTGALIDPSAAQTKVQPSETATVISSSQGEETKLTEQQTRLVVEQPKSRFPLLWIGVGALAVVGVVIALSLGMLNKANQPSDAGATAVVKVEENIPTLQSFNFELRIVDETGQVTERRRGDSRYYSEDLGDGVTLDMLEIQGGSFLMGSPDSEQYRFDNEGPQHEVKIPRFYMGKFEVTQAQWRVVANYPKVNMDLDPDPSGFKGEDRPVENVSWKEAMEFCDRLSKKTGRAYRLPTEAEWEYACRGRTKTPFHFGKTITTDLVNYDGDFPYGSAPKGLDRRETMIAGKLGIANAFGLFNMHGNVREWCLDAWHDDYRNAPTDGSEWKADNENVDRVMRGASWYDSASACRSAARLWVSPDGKSRVNGFRVVVSEHRIQK